MITSEPKLARTLCPLDALSNWQKLKNNKRCILSKQSINERYQQNEDCKI